MSSPVFITSIEPAQPPPPPPPAPLSPLPKIITIIRGNIVTPNEIIYGGWIEVRGEEIVRVERGDVQIPDEFIKVAAEEQVQQSQQVKQQRQVIIEAPFVVPGFVDIHNHGLGGIEEVCDHWLVPEFSQKELCRTGTLSVVASLILAADNGKRTNELITSVRTRCGKVYDDCCVIEGIHCEGPIIADCGGLPAQDVTMSLEKFKMLVDSMGDDIKVMTISPSLDATFEPPFGRIKYLLERGVRPSLGHDRKASEEAIVGALSLPVPIKDFGPMHTTHYCNVMSWSHRDVSLVNYINCNRFPKISKYAKCVPPTTEAIMDLVHVHGLTLQGLLSARAPKDVAVISDCISSYEPGKRLRYNGRNIMVRAEGGCYLCDDMGRPTLTLAGSSVTIADQFFTLVSVFGVDIVAACRMTATTPATIARIDKKTGSIEVGKKANLLLLDGSMGKIERRMVYGRWMDGYKPYKMLKPVLSNL